VILYIFQVHIFNNIYFLILLAIIYIFLIIKKILYYVVTNSVATHINSDTTIYTVVALQH